MNAHDVANLLESLFFGIIILLLMGLVLTFLSGMLYLTLKKFFGKRTESTETEPGQVPRKVKKAAPAPAVEAVAPGRIEPTFGETPALAALAAHTASRLPVDDEDVVDEQDAAAAERGGAFADRMADQFAAEPVAV